MRDGSVHVPAGSLQVNGVLGGLTDANSKNIEALHEELVGTTQVLIQQPCARSSPPLKDKVGAGGALSPAGQAATRGAGVGGHAGHARHAVQLEVEVGEAALLEG